MESLTSGSNFAGARCLRRDRVHFSMVYAVIADRSGCRLPEVLRGQPRALGHRLELGPGDLRFNLVDRPRESREAAVGTCYDALPPDDFGVAHKTLGDQFRMLDEVGRRVEDPRDD